MGRKAFVGNLIAMVAVVLSLCAPGVAHAQTFRGTILGTVTDNTGAVIPGAEVSVRNIETGIIRTTETDSVGNFTVPELPIGVYELSVQLAGFQKVVASNIKVEVAGERRVDVTLTPAGANQTVTVEATVALVSTSDDTLGGVIESARVDSLPVNGRDFTKLLVLVPGASGAPDGGTDSPGSFGLFSINGNRGRSNNYLLDGTDMNDGFRNLPAINQGGVFGTPATILPIEAVAEVGVLSHFETEYGRSAGSVVNIVTKSGGNKIHGSAYEFFRNNKLDARNYFNAEPNPETQFRNNQFGVAAGGPLVRDRTFWFVSYEGQREKVGLNSVARVPDPAEIAALGGPTNPVIEGILDRNPWPAPNNPVPLFDPAPNVFLTTRASNRVDSLIIKVDHNFNKSNMLTGRYYFGDSDQSFPLAILAGNQLPGFNTVTPTRVQLVSLSFVHVPSTRQVNETRFGYNRFFETFSPEDNDFDPGSIGLNTGVTNPRDFGLPVIRIRNDPALGSAIAPLGSTISVPRGRVDTNWHFIDNFSWNLPKHHIKLGYEFRRTFVNGYFDAGYRGRLDFASLQDFLQGTLSGGRSAQGQSQRGTFQNSHAGYLQDSFQVRRNLTFNYGIRWDYYGVIAEEQNRLSNFDTAKGLVPVGSGELERLYDRDFNNFSPRLALAWNIGGKGKTVVRAGWGMFYDAFSQDFFVGQLPFNTFNPGAAYNPIGPSGVLFSYTTTDVLVPGAPVFKDYSDSDVFATQSNLRTPYVQNYNLNLQQEIFKGVVLQMGYVGSQGRKLFRYRDINQPVDPAVSTARPFDNGPFAPSGGTFYYVNLLESSAASNYNGLQAGLNVQNRYGINSTLNFSYGHSIDNASDGQDYVANATQPDNSHRPDLERANSNFDIRKRFSWTISYEIPQWTKGSERLTGGWQVSGALSLQSGAPFHVNLFDDYNGTGEYFPRPDLVGDPYAGTHTPDSYLNLSAFAVPCTLDPSGDGSAGSCLPGSYRFGTLGRNSLHGPGYRNFDLALVKTTKVNERLKIQFRAEFFNFFNHPNFGSPLYPGYSADASLNGIDAQTGRGIGFMPLTVTPDVGLGNPFLGGGGPRNIQMALKLMF